jgi:uncharacterized iron-regulated membrane protein
VKLAFFFRKYHKWLALIVGLQALVWVLSGLYMTAVPINFIHGDHLVKQQKEVSLSDQPIKPLEAGYLENLGQIKEVRLSNINEQPVYLIRAENGLEYLNALTLEVLSKLQPEQIRAIADQVYAGKHQIVNIELLPTYPEELGGRQLPIWMVQYDDWLESTLYFTTDTGALRSKRSDLWRWFDFLWMLHIMDYDERSDITNSLLRIAAGLGLLLSLSGLGLLFYSFQRKKGVGQ